MKQSKRLLAVLGAVCALNFIGHLICLPFLPDVIPVHWNFAGQADGWGPKETNLILAALPALRAARFDAAAFVVFAAHRPQRAKL